MMKVYIMDWGIVFQSKLKTNCFSLADLSSVQMKIDSYKRDNHPIDLVVLSDEFVKEYVTKDCRQVLDIFKTMFKPITNSVIETRDFGFIENLTNQLTERQKKNFMFCS